MVWYSITAKGFSVEDTMTDDLYFNISEIKLSITSLYIISDTPKCDIIWTENSYVNDIYILEIPKHAGHCVLDWRTIHTPEK